jgi:hypothetical protein
MLNVSDILNQDLAKRRFAIAGIVGYELFSKVDLTPLQEITNIPISLIYRTIKLYFAA